MTPASFNSCSPRQVTTTLPPIAPRSPSFFSAREVGDSNFSDGSPISPGSLRHVDEIALDDSDSRPGDGDGEGTEPADVDSSEDELGSMQLLMPPGVLLPGPFWCQAPCHRLRDSSDGQWTSERRGKAMKRRMGASRVFPFSFVDRFRVIRVGSPSSAVEFEQEGGVMVKVPAALVVH
ncbi:hypothetical protein Hypma_007798 [Hypsizygus marmoreus]|uniref:Uncharacterized protein n=1 Tax=Hypsizygus marmoreus TaxID=39966 RepID=A0A369JW91_HYPMA|nr:hypothetical protein Hypma_007798 [Hypsizygus marmoreus]